MVDVGGMSEGRALESEHGVEPKGRVRDRVDGQVMCLLGMGEREMWERLTEMARDDMQI